MSSPGCSSPSRMRDVAHQGPPLLRLGVVRHERAVQRVVDVVVLLDANPLTRRPASRCARRVSSASKAVSLGHTPSGAPPGRCRSAWRSSASGRTAQTSRAPGACPTRRTPGAITVRRRQTRSRCPGYCPPASYAMALKSFCVPIRTGAGARTARRARARQHACLIRWMPFCCVRRATTPTSGRVSHSSMPSRSLSSRRAAGCPRQACRRHVAGLLIGERVPELDVDAVADATILLVGGDGVVVGDFLRVRRRNGGGERALADQVVAELQVVDGEHRWRRFGAA